MAYEFKKLSDVNVIESTNENAHVLAEQDGEIVRIPASSVGGGLPSGGAPHQQLVTDANGVAKWEDRFDPTAYPLPILYMNGDISGMDKDNKVILDYVFGERSGTLTCKWQGSSSLAYEKKNYTVVFDTAFEAHDGWGEQKKYCLKANYIDFSHARNVCAAKLWGEIRKARGESTAFYDQPNCGAIDGFPCVVVINGEYQGLYSFNIPKDAWMFGFTGETSTECILSAEERTDATSFKAAAKIDGTDFEFEHVGEGADTAALTASFNEIPTMLSWMTDIYTQSFQSKFDVTSAFDYFVFVTMLNAEDCINKNYLLVTQDGVKWQISAYDLDSIWGNHWSGKSYYKASYYKFADYAKRTKLFECIYNNNPTNLISRYRALRKGTLSEANVFMVLSNYLAQIPKVYFDEEVKVWKGIPGTHTNNLNQIMEHYRIKCAVLDAEIDALEESLNAEATE